MQQIAEGGLYQATFLYNPSMAASGVRIARLIALGEGALDDAEAESCRRQEAAEPEPH